MGKMTTTKRSPAADLIRIFAFFSVVSVHFFMKSGFYDGIVAGERMYIMTLMRSFFMICVPLFLVLSGFLLRKKQLEKSYYSRVWKIILTYLLASISCIVYCVVFKKQAFSLKDSILNILGFAAAPYSWYVEMYLGLFLLIPFLNIVYHAIPSQKGKLWLIATFVILTALPSVFNVYYWNSAWWALPSASDSKNKLIASWWETLYPITYYYIGCYLSEYGLKINKALNAGLIVVCIVVSGSYCYWRSYQAPFIQGAWCSYGSLFNLVLSVLVFVFFQNLSYEKLPEKLSLFLKKVSGLCLGAYLVSWIFDTAFYPTLLKKVPMMTDRLEYYFVMIPLVFVCSLLLSYILSKLQLLLELGFGKLSCLFRKKTQKQDA